MSDKTIGISDTISLDKNFDMPEESSREVTSNENNYSPSLKNSSSRELLLNSIDQSLKSIAPLWPLDRFVAVNPYFGLGDLKFDEAAEQLASVAGARTVMPAGFYLEKIEQGLITKADLKEALIKHESAPTTEPDVFIKLMKKISSKPADDERAFEQHLKSATTIASEVLGVDWTRFKVDQLSSFASIFFDSGQVLWPSVDRNKSLYLSWKESAVIDKVPEIMGLKGFRKVVRKLPDDPIDSIEFALNHLHIDSEQASDYLHSLLLEIGGWSAHASRIVFEKSLYSEQDDTLRQWLAILVAFEYVFVSTQTEDEFLSNWKLTKESFHTAKRSAESQVALKQRAILQDAFDISSQRELKRLFDESRPAGTLSEDSNRKLAQIVFCIDVRSELYRRNLEAVNKSIDTIGFAGFFGFAAKLIRLGHADGDNQCPVLLTTGFSVKQSAGDPSIDKKIIEQRQLAHHVRRAWKSFKMGAVTCFSFVGPVGLAYLPKLFSDSFFISRPVAHPDKEGLPKSALDLLAPDVSHIALADKVAMAQGALNGMTLTKDFAKLVIIAGHGSSTVNNPYATGLDCGACGGHSGEQNARIASLILNDDRVRAELVQVGIEIPQDTWFVGALHDTTTDEIKLFDTQSIPEELSGEYKAVTDALEQASKLSRLERSQRLGLNPDRQDIDKEIVKMSRDWSQVRPEWGLANCRAFIAAPRSRTQSMNLESRSFLHSYDWRQDKDFSILNLILTAPVVVASWISLQYYASTVEPKMFGSGNKTLHNVVSRLGVIEGNSGDLRTGLPIQSVHDGTKFQHDPLRLTVILEAPVEEINNVLKNNELVRNLFDNEWLYMYVLDDEGKISHKYRGSFQWDIV